MIKQKLKRKMIKYGIILAIISFILFGIVAVIEEFEKELMCLVATEEANSSSGFSAGGIEYQIYTFFHEKGWTDIMIASMMGNWFQESHLNPGAIQSKSGDILAPGGIGLAQWTSYNIKEQGLLLYAKTKNRDGTYKGWDDAQTQIEFAYMCTDPAADRKGIGIMQWSEADFNTWKGETDVAKAAEWYCTKWERAGTPVMNVRTAKAQEYLNLIRSGGINNMGSDGYVGWMISVANDNTHGYSMTNRIFSPDVDCSSFVWYALKNNGYNINGYPFTTSNMGGVLTGLGFKEYRFTTMQELQAGDILVNPGSHTEVYIGNGQLVGAHSNYDGMPGDSSGREVCVGSFWGSWKYYYRK